MFKKFNGGDVALLCRTGTYFQAGLYEFKGALFAKVGAGFIRLRVNGTTTRQNTTLLYIESAGSIRADGFGRLITRGGAAFDIASFNRSWGFGDGGS